MNETKLPPCSPARRSATKRFLTQYLLERDLIGGETGSSSNDILPARRKNSSFSAPRPFHTDIDIGQIRLVSQTKALAYVAVLRHWTKNSFLVAPFSGFSSPATDEELTMSFRGGLFLEVLQIWNVRTAMEKTLRKSWLVGTLAKQDLDDALLLWKWSIGDVAELPDRIAERTGVPIYRTDDPRLDYRREALENFAAFDAEDDANAEQATADFSRMLKVRIADILAARSESLGSRLAAGDKEHDETRAFLIPAFGIQIDEDFSPSEGKSRFVVYDKTGKEDEQTLEGFGVVDREATLLGTIQNGFLEIEAPAPLDEFFLVHPETQEIVEPKRKD